MRMNTTSGSRINKSISLPVIALTWTSCRRPSSPNATGSLHCHPMEVERQQVVSKVARRLQCMWPLASECHDSFGMHASKHNGHN